jgi:hypothetical protein
MTTTIGPFTFCIADAGSWLYLELKGSWALHIGRRGRAHGAPLLDAWTTDDCRTLRIGDIWIEAGA